jgi:pilus assembly protein CpaB
MNLMRFAILGVAFIAAAAAVLLARGMLGGGTPVTQAAPAPVTTIEILVASKDISPGHSLDPDLVHWESWPKKSVPAVGFITKETQPDLTKAVMGVVVRAPLVSGQPVTEASIVHAGATGFLAATIKPGLRAIGVPVNADTSAGGFILPNDRVDVVLSRDISAGGIKNFESQTILRDVRVLAVDQTALPAKDQQSVVGKTATLELTPDQSELLARSQQMGVLSLVLRALGDSSGEPVAEIAKKREAPAILAPRVERRNTSVNVIRFGVRREATAGAGEGGASSAPAPASSGGSDSGNPNPVSVRVVPSPMAAMSPQ